MPSIESIISKQLNIRFIDAHVIATEAKLNLGIFGYITDDHHDDKSIVVVNEACRIFQEERSNTDKIAMKVLHSKLKTIINHQQQSSCCDDSLDAATTTTSTNIGQDSLEDSSKKKKLFFSGRFWQSRRNNVKKD